ncbi:hypothetical protein HPC49_11100 [Pyxidicoccus fallax]|uniref:MORN repeat-containing protein n=1 Tax=Pyxidicoccus fallax TaxID=394095 RepID=A0A848LB01_9BACT|nr:hypothetical protein [Pyxidicoccus fallax]NMO15666.1 hypothetical protein [Pyxidicoccus fallax]NPC78786.1 hypothetical protein [Pyxidicoccus fallax]
MKRVPRGELSYDADDGLTYFEGEPFTGIARGEFIDGTLESEAEFREGLLWGHSRAWHGNGALAEEADYFQDVKHGVSREWSPEGVLQEETECEYGIVLSKRKWDEKGTLVEEYRLKETDSAYERLLQSRKVYGPSSA